MAESLLRGLAQVRAMLLDETLVRAVASGRRRGAEPRWSRAELRYVDLKAGPHLQVVTLDERQAHTANHAAGDAAREAVDTLLDEPFGSWHVATTEQTLQLRVTKRGEALVHSSAGAAAQERSHDRLKDRLLPEDDPVLVAVGISDERGRVKPTRQGKYRQVEELLRALSSAVADVTLPTDRPLRLVDLGCGNAYLTVAAHRYLSAVRGLRVETVGVDVKEQSLEHNTALAASLQLDGLTFVRGTISDVDLDDTPDVVLALHACDTATDDALARAVSWGAPLVLAAPCCHHDIAAQLRRTPTPSPYASLTRDGILRERFADTLTDALRAAVLRQAGYRVDVMEFVESKHTPRNTLIRAVRTGAAPSAQARAELAELTATWGVEPRLSTLLADRVG